MIGSVLSIDMSLAPALSDTLSIEDCYDIMEVAAINAHNFTILKSAANANGH